MADQASPRIKADVIARQNAEAERMLSSPHPPHKHLAPVYGSGLSLMGFIASALLGILAPIALVFIVGSDAPNSLFPLVLIYSVIVVVVAVICYLNLERAHAPSGEVAFVFTFALTSALEIWVPFGGVLTAVAAYFVMSHNGWLEG